MTITLDAYHTMKLRATCRDVQPFYSLENLLTLSDEAGSNPVCVLGSGSNVILPHHFDGLVLINAMQGVYQLSSCDQFVEFEVAGGENWHDFVTWSVHSGCYGLENLALIPGTVGAAPVQNIGAYGVEIADFLVSCRVWDRYQKKVLHLTKTQCGFSYRGSIFKHQAKGRYVILAVRLRLYKQPKCCLTYPRLRQFLQGHRGVITPKSVLDAVVSIRQRRLPDWKKTGTVGSFFTNPIISSEQADQLKGRCENLSMIALANQEVKLFAGELLSLAGWRGYAESQLATSAINPLVLVHKGGGTRSQLREFTRKLQYSVQCQFGIDLQVEPEVFPDEDGWSN